MFSRISRRQYRNICIIVIPATILVYMWLFTVGRVTPGRDDTGWAHITLGVCTFLPAMLLMRLRATPAIRSRIPRESPLKGFWLLAIALLPYAFLYVYLRGWFDTLPVSINFGDVLPQIWVMNKRLGEGVHPYDIIWDFGYRLKSPYLTLHWLPFWPAQKLGTDMRWVAIIGWILGHAGQAEILRRSQIHVLAAGMLVLLPFLFFWLTFSELRIISGTTAEYLIGGYYLFFSSLLLLSPRAGTSGWILVLLSRYGAVFFFPAWVRGIWATTGRRAAFIRTGIIGLSGIVLFVLPFWLSAPGIVSDGLAYHQKAMKRRWVDERNHGPNGKPALLYEGFGMARFVYETGNRTPADSLRLASGIHLGMGLLTGVGLALLASAKRWRRPGFRLGGLLFSLSVFYHFLPLPIDYYFIVPGIVLISALASVFVACPDSET